MERGDSFALVDLRTRWEVEKTGILSGAIHIPVDDLRSRLEELDPEHETILYCAQGLRSYLGNRIMTMNGFKRVKTLTGGTFDWVYGMESSK